MNPSGAINGESKGIQSDPALARVMRPDMYCTDSSGAPIPNCGIPDPWERSKDFAGGSKERVMNFMSPNGTLMDLNMATTLANEYTSLLAGPLNQITTTYVYADSGAAAGLNQSIDWSHSVLNAYNLSLNHLASQTSDPVMGDVIANKMNGCIRNQLKGAAHGNWPMAFSMCTADRTVSSGNFYATVGMPAKLGDIPQHAPTGGFSFGAPPSMPENQHSVLAEVFNPLIYSAPNFAFFPEQPTKADYIDLYNDAKKLLGDVIYTETYEPEGIVVSNVERWRSSNAGDDPSSVFRSMLKKSWNAGNLLLWKICEYTNSQEDVDVSSHDPLPWSVIIGSQASDFWASINGGAHGWIGPTNSNLLSLSFQSFQFKAVGADLLFASFKRTQEQVEAKPKVGADPMTGKGRKLDCEQLNTAFGGKAVFDDLLTNSGGALSYANLKEFRQELFEVVLRIALGQWLDTLRVTRDFFLKVSSGFAGSSDYQPAQLALKMVYETAGVADSAQLEDSFRKNREQLEARFKSLESKYSAELGRGSGSIASMFSDLDSRGDRGSAATSPMAAS
ncbi:MAG: hypothetical protein K1X79_05220 [Oligoflexia bacterium]|nr:hypothetical protein [Oligoflexia bacterium]